MFVFRKEIGKLKHLSYYEKNQIIDNLPVNIGYDVVAMVGTGDEKYDYYDLKLFRKKDKDGKSQWKKCLMRWIMTRNEFIKLLKDNLKPNAEIDFLLIDRFDDGRPISVFLDIRSVGMNVDIDDPNNKNRGGVVFDIKLDLMKGE